MSRQRLARGGARELRAPLVQAQKSLSSPPSAISLHPRPLDPSPPRNRKSILFPFPAVSQFPRATQCAPDALNVKGRAVASPPPASLAVVIFNDAVRNRAASRHPDAGISAMKYARLRWQPGEIVNARIRRPSEWTTRASPREITMFYPVAIMTFCYLGPC